MKIIKSILLMVVAILLFGCSSIDEELYDPMVKNHEANEILNTVIL